MIDETNVEKVAETAPMRRAVKLPPKRRSKAGSGGPTVDPVISIGPRQPRMKRSGPMLLHCRSGPDGQRINTIRISPETLSAFNSAIDALENSPPKGDAHAAA